MLLCSLNPRDREYLQMSFTFAGVLAIQRFEENLLKKLFQVFLRIPSDNVLKYQPVNLVKGTFYDVM